MGWMTWAAGMGQCTARKARHVVQAVLYLEVLHELGWDFHELHTYIGADRHTHELVACLSTLRSEGFLVHLFLCLDALSTLQLLLGDNDVRVAAHTTLAIALGVTLFAVAIRVAALRLLLVVPVAATTLWSGAGAATSAALCTTTHSESNASFIFSLRARLRSRICASDIPSVLSASLPLSSLPSLPSLSSPLAGAAVPRTTSPVSRSSKSPYLTRRATK